MGDVSLLVHTDSQGLTKDSINTPAMGGVCSCDRDGSNTESTGDVEDS